MPHSRVYFYKLGNMRAHQWDLRPLSHSSSLDWIQTYTSHQKFLWADLKKERTLLTHYVTGCVRSVIPMCVWSTSVQIASERFILCAESKCHTVEFTFTSLVTCKHIIGIYIKVSQDAFLSDPNLQKPSKNVLGRPKKERRNIRKLYT